MKERLLFPIKFYVALVVAFAVTKPLFMLAEGIGRVADWPAVIWHGLPLDLATAGYLASPLWLVVLISIWVRIKWLRMGYRVYAGIVAVLLSLIFVGNACLYTFWGFPLDGTVLGYLDSPRGAAASVSVGYVVTVAIVIIGVAVGAFFGLCRLLPQRRKKNVQRQSPLPRGESVLPRGENFISRGESAPSRDEGALPRSGASRPQVSVPIRRRIGATVAGLVVGGLLFLAIRGGMGKSTANVGMVYFSAHQQLNHAAVNPAFSIFSSLLKTKDFSREHQVFDEARRAQIFGRLGYGLPSIRPDTLLNSRRPNVLIIIMEGCGGTLVNAIDPLSDPQVTPHLNRLAREGVLFSQCYANSFRTDRGVLSTLSGYPAFPDVSVMKMPAKCAALPGIASALRRAGYSTDFLYGGDIDFTNMRGYLLSTGYDKTYGDKDFPANERHTHNWGVTDRLTFDRLMRLIASKPNGRPWHTAFLTLASHEPWGVPYSRIKGDTVANAFAYLDDCVGRFIDRFRRTPAWRNTLVILLPDHGIGYPSGIADDAPRRSHIPMIWTGGAVREARVVDKLCNQSDLAATLLGQLGLPHTAFPFSRDVVSSNYRWPSAVHTWSGGIFFIDGTGVTALNLVTQPATILRDAPTPSATRRNAANAFLQTAYRDLGRR